MIDTERPATGGHLSSQAISVIHSSQSTLFLRQNSAPNPDPDVLVVGSVVLDTYKVVFVFACDFVDLVRGEHRR